MFNFFRKRLKFIAGSLILTMGLSTAVPGAGASAVELKNDPVIESFTVQTFTDFESEDKIIEETSYKSVNSILETSEVNGISNVDLLKVEDYYDLSGNYIHTLVARQQYVNDLNTGEATTTTSEEIINTPTAIQINNTQRNAVSELDPADEKIIKNNVLKFTSNLGEGKTEEVPGYTRQDVSEMISLAKELQENYTLEINEDAPSGEKIKITPMYASPCDSTVRCNGAFDNYWNYDFSTGEFKVQVLSDYAQHYHGVKGSTLNSTKNSQSLQIMMGYIDQYERDIIGSMDYNRHETNFTWLVVITSLVSIVKGVVGGPPGWLELFTMGVSVISIFRDMTSATYATNRNVELSKSAMSNLQIARHMMVWPGSYFENYTYFGNVRGY